MQKPAGVIKGEDLLPICHRSSIGLIKRRDCRYSVRLLKSSGIKIRAPKIPSSRNYTRYVHAKPRRRWVNTRKTTGQRQKRRLCIALGRDCLFLCSCALRSLATLSVQTRQARASITAAHNAAGGASVKTTAATTTVLQQQQQRLGYSITLRDPPPRSKPQIAATKQ